MAAVGDVLWPPLNRLGNTEWCDCSKCRAMPERLDCICCQDAAITLERTREHGVRCVAEIPDFETVVLHQQVLATAWRGYFEMKQQPKQLSDEPDNRSLRYAAYRQYTLFIHGKLGRHVRCRIPSCAVNVIRAKYPNPEGEPYQGFREAEDEPVQWPDD
ncbi:P2X purinoceptor 7-like [Sycon ciliatum]|uniref:P2X purinoceptor 7-like n=1 Tax=Sycon ciliatum TaxID=27933 RepID=UPI0031F6FDAA